ncbi:unnamed protein product [Rotaria sp. Silwood2]|nr:unnamed protein product [Rotaria sp. Silwood2]
MKIRSCLNLIHRFQSTSSAVSRSRLTNDEIRAHHLRIFANEHQTQMEHIRRVEKNRNRYSRSNTINKIINEQININII